MSKKLMFIIIPAAALATFGGAFMAAYMGKKASVKEDPSLPVAIGDPQIQQGKRDTPSGQPTVSATPPVQSLERLMSDQQLRDLVREVGERRQDLDIKIKSLDIRERNLQTAKGDLQGDIDKLNNLRVDLAKAVVELKQQQKLLEDTRIRIDTNEVAQIQTVAKTLEGMTSENAAQLLTNICQNKPTDPDVATEAVGEAYAVKLLNYVSIKNRPTLMNALTEADPALAGRLLTELKRILEIK